MAKGIELTSENYNIKFNCDVDISDLSDAEIATFLVYLRAEPSKSPALDILAYIIENGNV